MSWIDIYLSDGNPEGVFNADAQKALTYMGRWRDIPYHWLVYRKSDLKLAEILAFLILDIVRHRAYRRGFNTLLETKGKDTCE